jgi:hypothetical protein
MAEPPIAGRRRDLYVLMYLCTHSGMTFVLSLGSAANFTHIYCYRPIRQLAFASWPSVLTSRLFKQNSSMKPVYSHFLRRSEAKACLVENILIDQTFDVEKSKQVGDGAKRRRPLVFFSFLFSV